MEQKEYLSEKKYQKNKKKLIVLAFLVLIFGLLIGGSLIAKGINNTKNTNNTYTEENKQTKINNLKSQINTEKINLETKKAELQAKGITPSHKYDSGEAYDLYILTEVLDPSFSHCSFDKYQNNPLTSKYCSLKNELEETESFDIEWETNWENFHNIPLYMFGGFIIIASFMMFSVIYSGAKTREITAYHLQQKMPIQKEYMEKMAPSVGNTAKEIAKGIKEGLKDEDEYSSKER